MAEKSKYAELLVGKTTAHRRLMQMFGAQAGPDALRQRGAALGIQDPRARAMAMWGAMQQFPELTPAQREKLMEQPRQTITDMRFERYEPTPEDLAAERELHRFMRCGSCGRLQFQRRR
jgi:hypothetical protein